MSYELNRFKSQAARLYLEALSLIKDLAKLLEPDEDVKVSLEEKFYEKTKMFMMARDQLVNNILVYVARAQPLGANLIEASNLLYLAYDMYRFARYAREILIADRRGVKLSTPGLREIIEPALRLAIEAVENAYKVYFEGRSECIDSLRKLGKESDELYMRQLEKIASSPLLKNTEAVALLVLRHVERIVDHAERVVSMRAGTLE